MTYDIAEPIYSRDDGTYEIMLNGMPFHATGLSEHNQSPDLIEAIKAYCTEHGITPGPKPIPEPEPMTAETARSIRDGKIASIRWRIERHTDEIAMEVTPTEDIGQVYAYIQELRDVPLQPGFPTDIKWPVEP